MTVDEMVRDVLRREGGYVNHPRDRGGPTNYGITQKTLDALGIKKSVSELAEYEAHGIYTAEYYLKPKIHLLPDEFQPIAFDMAVNHGPRKSIRMIQECVNNKLLDNLLEVDGIMGPKTADACKFISVNDVALLRIKTYAEIVHLNPSQSAFIVGWINRASEFMT